MTATIKQNESAPSAYPDAPDSLSTAAAALDADMLWQRIEAFTAWRFSKRDVIWTVEGYGCWQPPLAPATITTVEIWRGEEWQEITLPPSPLGGYQLSGDGPYRFTGTVGEDDADVPAAVSEAFRRLAEYMAAAAKVAPGVTRESVSAGSVTVDKTRTASFAARSLQNSGAGDLLRPYRRAP